MEPWFLKDPDLTEEEKRKMLVEYMGMWSGIYRTAFLILGSILVVLGVLLGVSITI